MKISEIEWSVSKYDDNILYRYYSGSYCITVLDRLTGYSDHGRDIETGYRNSSNKMWIVSGNFDIRLYGDMEVEQAIELIKRNANTCVGE